MAFDCSFGMSYLTLTKLTLLLSNQLPSLAGPQPAAKVGPPTEEALQRLSEARRQETGQPAARELHHTSSSMTTGSSLNTTSMSSTDTVLPRASNITSADGMGSMRKRHSAKAIPPVVMLRLCRRT